MECAKGAETVDLFVSGRLCLFGEHTDWAGEHKGRSDAIMEGRTIVVGTQEGIFATAKPLKEKVLRITTTDNEGRTTGPAEFALEPAELLSVARGGGFFSYVAGTAYRLVVAHDLHLTPPGAPPGPTHIGPQGASVAGGPEGEGEGKGEEGWRGLELVNHTTTLPMSKGLSSSAAVCVLVARAFNRVFGLRLSTRGEMEFAYQGEITTPSKCGRMDQACAYGSVPVLMTFDGDILTVDRVKLAAPLHLVLVDLKASKDTTTILRSLQQAYPHPTSDLHEGLHRLLGPINHRITGEALTAMAAGDLRKLGRLMVEAQAHFDQLAGPLCPDQLTAPVLHKVLSYPAIQELVWGGKGVGSQGDGTAQLLCRGPEEQSKVCSILREELGMDCMPLSVTVKPPGLGGAAAAAASNGDGDGNVGVGDSS
ncbi:hypothetical protein PLESTB_001809800 [Pleodorina starrii]|uniref:GHMP kinase N-terminal domain-containing protein n=1 Tax=Pleodorina starrii TaxID=330485 RepID=A0A9W6FAM7_9CHLO|nr:hypothetical protein PLESTM_000906000 [Pleodorina starrii]GLC61846.1 hypothetical protein PLESTB_001809800 [Pleodorina starrii]GLC76907.1 hypothetical protein PLESTF_001854200 [Pleodorina starrii]